MNINEQKLLEELSELEHQQWICWAQNILQAEAVSNKTQERWKKYFVPYSELTQELKNLDRSFARKSLEIFKKHIKENN